ncbi:uncharacterized protein LOC141665017 [Apium graveolens]|uniref:uncharacterized protein LOC141665017 n=1 Tax=Apium graveolens TaxID=4045 RepID=UPI003D7B05E7
MVMFNMGKDGLKSGIYQCRASSTHFFYCCFVVDCWRHVGLLYDMGTVEYAYEWLLSKLNESSVEEIVKLCTVLWRLWFWRNKKVWEGKEVTAAIVMDSSFMHIAEWKEARQKNGEIAQTSRQETRAATNKWRPPESGTYKVNVDASFSPDADTFSIGMVLRDHHGHFRAGKTLRLSAPASVIEAEVIGTREALSWVKEQ